MQPMETVHDLIEEAKLRTVYWVLCIFAVSYFLSHTSKSMWMNIPISVLFVSALRVLFNEVEFRWKVRKARQQTYLSHLEKKQLSVNDYRLSASPPPPKWKGKIDSPLVEASMEEFVNKLLQDFVTDLWYSDITPDKEAPKLMHAVIMDVIGEISGRLKEINLVDLLTRDVVDLVGDHLDLFRRNQAAIGVDVMGTLSLEERDERFKHHLMASKELHPALISPECEYKVLQRIIGGLLALVLRPREAQCPLVRCIAQELVTCLVMQPIMNFANPAYINELIEYIFLVTKDDGNKEAGDDQSPNLVGRNSEDVIAPDDVPNEFTSRKNRSSYDQGIDLMPSRINNQKEISLDASENLNSNLSGEEPMQPRPAGWARVLEAATQRRTEVLMPENLENMWTKGRNYKKNIQKSAAAPVMKGSRESSAEPTKILVKEMSSQRPVISSATEISTKLCTRTLSDGNNNLVHLSHGLNKHQSIGGAPLVDKLKGTASPTTCGNKGCLKRSNSTSALNVQPHVEKAATSGEVDGPIISEFYTPDFGRRSEVYPVNSASNMVLHGEGIHSHKLRCRVIGAYFEKLGSKSFAVYSITVTDADKNTWFVKRRYRNFERLHRHLKDIPNYTLHLPPKRIFSSSTEDAFVHQRCIQLNKYLQDLLSIANVAEQHELWDFLSASSKNYSFEKSSSVMRTLAVNVDDAVDDIVRQFKGVSDGLMQKVVGSSSFQEGSLAIPSRNLSWNPDDISKHLSWRSTTESANSGSDIEEGDKDGTRGHEEVGCSVQANGWHSDNELNSKGFPPRVIKRSEKFRSTDLGKKCGSETDSLLFSLGGYPPACFTATSNHLEDAIGVPEWTPPNLSIPVLNLVDKMFQLNRRGWLRRQVFWMSKQILQLMMEDAIDDWLLRQIQWLRRDDVIAQGIRWVQNVLWPDGIFFLRLRTQSKMDDCQPDQRSFETTSQRSQVSNPGSFEQQLEAARRASDIKKMIFNGAPTTLVSLIGHKQYRHCAKDIYFFLQSTVCLKQLAYGILELVMITVFPELRDLVVDIHKKMRAQSVYKL
ncbi:uncharacterized protein LOC130781836 isoform X1 [Actinidia eriantha]|uniref:uncharacterized protein LOC130781836 isoform X1 n=2 Tax=Actinidia eriantha TaxID=165200 RepID=UPI00258B96C7|nr:uncharacterized protein LOC130781836 isoform X1 [Actinidia eriantha]